MNFTLSLLVSNQGDEIFGDAEVLGFCAVLRCEANQLSMIHPGGLRWS